MIKKILLYLSAFIPMYFLVELKLIVEIINNNLTFNILNTTMFVLLLLLMVSGVIGLLLNTKWNKAKSISIKIKSITNLTDQQFLGYFSLFVLFALTFELEKISMSCVFVVILLLIGIVYITNNFFYLNPLLNILGYSFYDVTFINSVGEERKIKIFCRGVQLKKGQNYFINLDNENFSFIDKNSSNIKKA